MRPGTSRRARHGRRERVVDKQAMIARPTHDLFGALGATVIALSHFACRDSSRSGAASSSASASGEIEPAASASSDSRSASLASSVTPLPTVVPSASSSSAPSASAVASRDDTGPCAEPRVLLSVQPPAETPRAIARARRAIQNVAGLAQKASSTLGPGEIRLETAEYAGLHFEHVDTNRIALMAVCGDRSKCADLALAYRVELADCRCEKLCAPPIELVSKPLTVDSAGPRTEDPAK